jgi:hypothetical protein
MNVSYLSPDGRDSKQSARVELHRNLVLPQRPVRNADEEKNILKTPGIELYRSGAAHRREGTYARAKLSAGAVISATRM